jgi:hypothetical protein
MLTDFLIYQFARNITRSGLCNIILHAEIEYMYVDVILFVMCKENHTICNVYIILTQPMFGSCFISCLLDGEPLQYSWLTQYQCTL